jgi:hypothetical protein
MVGEGWRRAISAPQSGCTGFVGNEVFAKCLVKVYILCLAAWMLVSCFAAPSCPPTQPCPVTPSTHYSQPIIFTPLAHEYPFPATVESSTTTPTPLPVFSPTPSSTHIPIPTATQLLPTVSPPVQTVTADHLPLITHDILYISGFQLNRWDHATGKIVTLAGPTFIPGQGIPPGSVIDYSASQDGKWIALSIFVGPAERDYQIILLDSETGHQTPIIEVSDIGAPLELQMSPDGKWLAYILQDKLGNQPITATPTASTIAYFDPPHGGIVEAGKIWAVQIAQPGIPIEIGNCAIKLFPLSIRIPCRSMLWSPDSLSVAWSDGVGLWIVSPKTQARLLVENEISMGNMGNFYEQQAWSPSGNYLLAETRHYEGSDRVVVDVLSGKVAEVENSHLYSMSAAQMAWMLDDRLFVVRPGQYDSNVLAMGEIYRFDPKLTYLFKEGSIIIPAQESLPLAPIQIDESHLGFLEINTDFANDQDRGVYFFDMTHFQLSKVISIMPLMVQDARLNILWAPDGSSVLITGDGYYLALTDGSVLFDLSPVFGTAWKFTWVEEP